MDMVPVASRIAVSRREEAQKKNADAGRNTLLGIRLPLIPGGGGAPKANLDARDALTTMHNTDGWLRNQPVEQFRNDTSRAAVRFFTAYSDPTVPKRIDRVIRQMDATTSALRPLMYVKGGFAEPVMEVPARLGWRVMVNPYPDVLSDQRAMPNRLSGDVTPPSSENVIPHSKEPSTPAIMIESRVLDQPPEATTDGGDRFERQPIERGQQTTPRDADPSLKPETPAGKANPTPGQQAGAEPPVVQTSVQHPIPPGDGRMPAVVPDLKDNLKIVVRSSKLGSLVFRSESQLKVLEVPVSETTAAKNDSMVVEDTPKPVEKVVAVEKKSPTGKDLNHDSLRHAVTNSSPTSSAQTVRTPQSSTPSPGRWDSLVHFVEKIMKNATITHHSDGLSELKVRMTSESLGKVMIQLAVMDDHVNLQFVADTSQARQVLNAYRDELVQVLKDSGASTVSIDVSTSSPESFERHTVSEETGDRPSGSGFAGSDWLGSSAALESAVEDDVNPNYAARMLFAEEHSSMVWVA